MKHFAYISCLLFWNVAQYKFRCRNETLFLEMTFQFGW